MLVHTRVVVVVAIRTGQSLENPRGGLPGPSIANSRARVPPAFCSLSLYLGGWPQQNKASLVHFMGSPWHILKACPALGAIF